ncbi:MAG: PqqD family peptide modification chaperone [Paracoccaceae bacterium]|nr:MAG: PqqD family peptide modification chaperone [Paracoccaceae bacterium]
MRPRTATAVRGHRGRPAPGRPAPDLRHLRFPGVAAPVVLPSPSDAMAQALARCLSGWTPAPWGGTAPRPLCATLPDPGTPGHYVHAARDLDPPLTGLPAASAVCAVVADLAMGFCDALPGGIGLHCGAVEIGGCLILLTGRHKAGKSTLVARLSAEPGARTVCDDVLPLDAHGRAIALGIPPRLRLPLPPGAGPVLAGHLARHTAVADDRYAYLSPPNLVPHGTRLAPGALIRLHRGAPGTPARLHRMDRAEALHLMLSQSLSCFASAEDAFARADRMTAGLPAMTLVYADLDDAAALLVAAFAEGAQPDPAAPLPATDDIPAAAPLAPGTPVAAVAGCVLRRRDGGAFLWRAGDMRLWRLNPVAQAVWTLIAETPGGIAPAAIAATLADAFPDTPPQAILADICAITGALAAEGFAESA